MLISAEQITSWLGVYLWTLVRIAALVMAAPVINSRNIPSKVKLGIALVLTMVIAPTIPPVPAVDPISGEAIMITLQQVLIGVAMGLSLQVVYAMVVIGGQVIAYQMGLGFSQMVDPQTGLQVPVVSQFYIIVLTLVYFAINGHLVLIEVLADSFKTLPIANAGIGSDGIWSIITWSSQMYIGGVKMALPAIAAILLVNFTFGVVTRSAPQFNIFSIGFPITMIMGFFIMMVTFSGMLPHLERQLSEVFFLMRDMLRGAP